MSTRRELSSSDFVIIDEKKDSNISEQSSSLNSGGSIFTLDSGSSMMSSVSTPSGTLPPARSPMPENSQDWYVKFDRDCVQERPGDDMLFYVRQGAETLPAEDRVLVRRWTADNKLTPASKEVAVDWEATYYLNFIVNHLSYELEFKIFRKGKQQQAPLEREATRASSSAGTTSASSCHSSSSTSTSSSAEASGSQKKNYQLLRRSVKPIFAAPNHVRIDKSKSEQCVEHTYPEVFFTIHDHDMADDSNLLAASDEYMAINLTANGRFLGHELKAVELFRGAAAHPVVWRAFSSTRRIVGSKKSRGQYLTLRGPRGKGRAQMSVATAAALKKMGVSVPDSPKTERQQQQSSSIMSSTVRAFSSLLRGSSVTSSPSSSSSSLSTSTSPGEPLYCSLVFCALPWEVIVSDLSKKIYISQVVK